MRIKEILNENIKIYPAKPMSCPSCKGTGKDQYGPTDNCQDCQGIGSFSQPAPKSIKNDKMMTISENYADVLYDLLQLMKVDTMNTGGYITQKDFGNIRRRIMQLKNEDLTKYERSDEIEPGRRIKTTNSETGLPTIQFIPSRIINPGITKEEIKELLDNFEKVIIDAQQSNLALFMDDSERPF